MNRGGSKRHEEERCGREGWRKMKRETRREAGRAIDREAETEIEFVCLFV